jgi:hypothetical protein
MARMLGINGHAEAAAVYEDEHQRITTYHDNHSHPRSFV